MDYALDALAAYLVGGLILTRYVLKAPSHRMRLRDYALGGLVMPVLFVVLLGLILIEDLWKKLLLALDFDPPEEMRAGPKPSPEQAEAE